MITKIPKIVANMDKYLNIKRGIKECYIIKGYEPGFYNNTRCRNKQKVTK